MDSTPAPARTSVTLALGGGGARGYAHIGVIQVLEENGFDVVGVAGTSMGALIGGLHAAGHLDAYADWVSSLTPRDIIRLIDPSLRSPGAIKGERIMAKVIELLDGVRIEDLPVPFTAVATDLLHRKEVWFQEGPLDMAIRASIALPSFFAPVVLNGRLLADGGMTNPVPIAPLSGQPSDLTVAVNLSGPPSGRESLESWTRASSEPGQSGDWQEKLARTATQVLDNEAGRRISQWLTHRRHDDHDQDESASPTLASSAPEVGVSEAFEELPSALNMIDVVELSYDALESVVLRYRLASYPPDLMVTLPKNICRTLDFHRAAEMIQVGREYTERALAERERAAGF
ncbi:patatin-like phospholipase family protein [Nocardioides yefusunii]|uniref:Patatin-like phospholipase family protein n=1 Tax=Nocardioides yefusunii TaxID=2500546 RepID=A0ABW1QYU6_9ACTN|nr:patatin-like phospholipase family protein [Nocardioides yefusunii]